MAPPAACQATRSSTSVSGPRVVKVKRPLRLQDARDFGENRVDVFAPGQHEVAEHEVDARIGQRNGLGLRAKPLDARRHVAPRELLQHGG